MCLPLFLRDTGWCFGEEGEFVLVGEGEGGSCAVAVEVEKTPDFVSCFELGRLEGLGSSRVDGVDCANDVVAWYGTTVWMEARWVEDLIPG